MNWYGKGTVAIIIKYGSPGSVVDNAPLVAAMVTIQLDHHHNN